MFKRIQTNFTPVANTTLLSNMLINAAATPSAAVSPAANASATINPNLVGLVSNLNLGGLVFNPGLVVKPPVVLPPVTPPANPPGMPDTLTDTELQILLNSLPVAQAGNVITSAHLNALRTAILNLAAKIGGAALSPTQLLNFLPAFAPGSSGPAWSLSDGTALAVAKVGGGSASGWLPVQIPDGWAIQAMTVIGDKTGSISAFTVELFKRALDGSEPQAVMTTSLTRAADKFNVTTQASGTPPVVDNRSTGYFVTADVTYSGDTSQARVFAIQIICTH